VVEARALVDKAERLLKTADSDDREDLIDNIEVVRDAQPAQSRSDRIPHQ
jgi:hypothetical protein